MKKDINFNFELPQELIARQAKNDRASARMLCYQVNKDQIEHKKVSQIAQFFDKGDVCLINNAKVLKARFTWQYKSKLEELVLLKCLSKHQISSTWEAIVSGRKTKPMLVYEQGQFDFKILEKLENGLALVEINKSFTDVRALMLEYGKLPIPPYIRKMRKHYDESEDSLLDEEGYQTTFAEKGGAVAAPTAGLHFTDKVLKTLEDKGVELVKIQLDVGWGTFQPLSEKNWAEGKLHEERVFVSKQAASSLLKAKAARKQILAVGTTCIRSLQWWYELGMPEEDVEGVCDLFIHYPWQSPVATALLTNFHFPQTSLLHLVSAFINDDQQNKLMQLYQEAIKKQYMFYSYGDCMLIQH
ncbi:MAG TPA: tRNA preQ1(34) S-adenosylmethionine ribosyltransferase-isomerase QueA [Oligoflexia bacterium]|nr:tRNA preQ1(34) S-adenosylmethionine ribosyltransferase-isomerase QueA [Oligoflexia bacterium]HMR24125.1 tRNA preQ1(34) S-adenosylmethionine ribosyltransferase-isomerase QueA [Oligoflexia bacterium]